MVNASERLAAAMRRCIALLLDTDPPEDELAEAADALERLANRLSGAPRVVRRRSFGEPAVSGDPGALFGTSAVSGALNPVAPPLRLWVEDGVARGRGAFGRAYEGPPGHVHGGFIAAAFDEVLGMAQAASGRSGMTGRLTVHYRRPTPLYREVRFEAKLDRAEGKKILTKGALYAGDALCAGAEGLFVAVDFERHLRSFAPPDGS